MNTEEVYTPGYSANASSFMAQRSAQTHAAFALPYLHSGMQALDCGCGPGSITLGLAGLIAPGVIIGVDAGESQIEIARQNAARKQIENVRFETASVYHLPFADTTFDLVFSHALFEHLSDPLGALAELTRVLKPGGKIALRSPDWGGFLIAPYTQEVNEAITFYKALQTRNGGDVYIGRKLKALLRQAGFDDVQASATYECYPSLNFIGEYLALRIEQALEQDRVVEQGLATASQVVGHAAALRQWSREEDGLFAQAWGEAIGTKP